jgi:hypothetical protein
LLLVAALVDQDGGRRVAQVVEPEPAGELGAEHRGLVVADVEVVVADRPALGGGEDKPVGRGVTGDVLGQDVDQGGWDRYLASAPRLGGLGDQPPPDFAVGFDHGQAPA